MGNVKIRQLQYKDYADFLNCISALKPTNLTEAEFRNLYNKRVRTCKTFVTVLDGVVVGTATLLLEQKFIHNGGIVGHIEDVAINKDCQSQGLGKQLIEYVVGYAKKRGAYKVILDCQGNNVGFYSRCDFHIWENSMRRDL